MKTNIKSLSLVIAALILMARSHAHAQNVTTTYGGISAHGGVANPSGHDNTGVGYVAMYWGNSGIYNTAVGSQSLVANIAGHYNTVVGFGAGYKTTMGYNSAMGFQALYHTTTGVKNLALGMNAMFANTTGSNNIALGYEAGSVFTTGSNNIHIGHVGFLNDANYIRIGTNGTHTDTYLSGVVHSTKPIRIAPAGDLSMGAFTNGFLP